MMQLADQLAPLLSAASTGVGPTPVPAVEPTADATLALAKWIPWIPLLGSILCCLCCCRKPLAGFAGPICVLSIFASFLLSVFTFTHLDGSATVKLFPWIEAGNFSADIGYYLDTLTYMMLFVVTGIGTLIAWYATGYMKGDRGYARFFAGMAIFIFAMTNLVMADNLVLLYLGWEGVGFASWFLIGFYYDKMFAVAAAKKAFIVNRIGDLGFALGLFLTYHVFGSVQYADILPAAKAMLLEEAANIDALAAGAQAAYAHAQPFAGGLAILIIPFLLMLGAFGKSAQIPLYVWLPDAMAGPTPVSALVHAATMVTSGVYMISRLVYLFELSPYALPTVAVIGGITCLFAATIALCCNDLKGVFAYSTVSQLGYMFIGVGALTTFGGVFHLFTHAWFKALLFLTAGSVMHALAGQLDIRTMRGMGKYMPVTKWLMLAGCLTLAGLPLTSGFLSKDTILAESLAQGLNGSAPLMIAALLGIVTAGLTAFYTFRLWFMVFTGEPTYEMGDDHHGDDDGHGDDHGHEDHAHSGGHAPHEMPFLGMNLPLVVLAVGALATGWFFYGPIKGWVHDSTANTVYAYVEPKTDKADAKVEDKPHAALDAHHDGLIYVADPAAHAEPHAEGTHHAKPWQPDYHHPHHAYLLGLDIHTAMMIISGVIAVGGIALAFFMYAGDNIKRAQAMGEKFPAAVKVLQDKWYIDEIYDAVIVKPLRVKSHAFFVVDQLILDAMVQAVGWLPGNTAGKLAQKGQTGRLQGYGLGMAAGLAVMTVLIYIVLN